MRYQIHRRSILALALSASLFVPACASAPTREKAVVSLQAVQVGLGKVQDASRQICNTVAYEALALDARLTTPMTECTGPNATAARLTTERFRALSATLASAFALQQKAAAALLAWSPGAPQPAEVGELLGQAQSVLSIAQSLAATEQQKNLVSLGATVVAEVQKIIDAIRGGH